MIKRVRLRDISYRVLIIGLGLGFVYSLIWSDTGLVRYYSVKQEIVSEQICVDRLHGEVKQIEAKIDNWQKNPFFLEKMAREELGMGCRGEKVYLLFS